VLNLLKLGCSSLQSKTTFLRGIVMEVVVRHSTDNYLYRDNFCCYPVVLVKENSSHRLDYFLVTSILSIEARDSIFVQLDKKTGYENWLFDLVVYCVPNLQIVLY
jgi:hypothetical protein